jgi:AraC family transcriptional regulator, transcriptional activator of the genes for pyochelin and ferripyochelin receptors
MNPTNQMTASRFTISSIDLPSQFHQQQKCLHQSLPDKVGVGKSAIFQLDQDLSYIETRYTPSKALAILSKIDNQEPRLVVTLGLKGHSSFANYQGDDVIFKEGYTTITAFKSSNGQRQYEANKPVIQLRLSMSKRWLDKYFGEQKSLDLFSKKNAQLILHQPTSCQALMASRQLLARDVSQEVKPIFMHGQAMSILAAELTHLFEGNHQDSARFNEKDKAIAELARNILFHEFKNPPSVAELAIRAGTNQFKLKKIFHHFFDNTPYGLLSEFRMNHAYQLLESKRCHVSVVADLVGFSHASNFTAAFIKHFGVPPKSVAKKS